MSVNPFPRLSQRRSTQPPSVTKARRPRLPSAGLTPGLMRHSFARAASTQKVSEAAMTTLTSKADAVLRRVRGQTSSVAVEVGRHHAASFAHLLRRWPLAAFGRVHRWGSLSSVLSRASASAGSPRWWRCSEAQSMTLTGRHGIPEHMVRAAASPVGSGSQALHQCTSPMRGASSTRTRPCGNSWQGTGTSCRTPTGWGRRIWRLLAAWRTPASRKASFTARARSIPIEIVEPALVQIVGREQAPSRCR